MRTIYLDMDGVVADFDIVARQKIGYSMPGGTRYPEEDWKKLAENERLYRDLPLCPDAKLLVEEVLDIAYVNWCHVMFLTAIPRQNDLPWAFYDKVNWARDHFPRVPVWFGPYSRDKKLRAKPYDILIDDRISNINDWTEAGGIGILHTGDVRGTLDILKSHI